jgi:integrase
MPHFQARTCRKFGCESRPWIDRDQRCHRGKRRIELPLTFEELTMDEAVVRAHPEPWNKGKLVGQRAPFKLKEIWAIRVRLQLFGRTRELAPFDLGIDSKLRACDLISLKVCDICHGDRVANRAIVMQQKTSRPAQFEITEPTRDAVAAWIKEAGLRSEDYLFPSRLRESPQMGTRQYARIVDTWVEEIGPDPADYGTQSMRRMKASLIYRRTENLPAVERGSF